MGIQNRPGQPLPPNLSGAPNPGLPPPSGASPIRPMMPNGPQPVMAPVSGQPQGPMLAAALQRMGVR